MDIISYQGQLLTAAGQPAHGPVSVVFALYGDSTGGAAMWSEARRISGANVVSRGPRLIVNVMLGGTAQALPGMTIFSGPRLRLTNDHFNDAAFAVFIDRVQRMCRIGAV